MTETKKDWREQKAEIFRAQVSTIKASILKAIEAAGIKVKVVKEAFSNDHRIYLDVPVGVVAAKVDSVHSTGWHSSYRPIVKVTVDLGYRDRRTTTFKVKDDGSFNLDGVISALKTGVERCVGLADLEAKVKAERASAEKILKDGISEAAEVGVFEGHDIDDRFLFTKHADGTFNVVMVINGPVQNLEALVKLNGHVAAIRDILLAARMAKK